MIYCPCASAEEALRLGRGIVERKMAACVNILPQMTSAYWWEGTVQEALEAVLILKTFPAFRESVVQEIKKQHSYAVPAILCWEVGSGNEQFTAWMRQNLPHD